MIGRATRLRLRFAILLTSCVLVSIAGSVQAAQTSLPAVRLTLSAPTTVAAGSDVTIEVTVDGFSRGISVDLIIDGSFGPRLYRAPVVDGQASFAIPADDLSRSGMTTVVASTGSARARTTFEILPGAPVNPVQPYVGARSILADGVSWSMAVAAPVDALGNPVVDGTGVDVQTRRPDSGRQNWQIEVAHLLAWTRIVSGTLAGRTTVGMSAGTATGPDAVFDEVPGWPEEIQIHTLQGTPPADGATLVTINSDVMRDQFGNVVADGTAITFIARDPDGTERRISAYTVGGVAEIPLQAPNEPGVIAVRATIGEITSGELPITFLPGPAIGTFPVQVTIDTTAGTVALVAGPILGELNTFVPTGTAVTFAIGDANGQVRSEASTTNGGYASVTLRLADFAPGGYSVQATAGSGSGATEFEVTE